MDGKLRALERWPEIFAPLTAEQREAVEQSLVSAWHEGWNPGREDVRDLADEAAGIISVDEYLVRARQRAGRAGTAG